MRRNRWLALPLALVAAVAIGVAAVQAAPSPSPSAGTSSKNYGQVFMDKLAGILGLKSSTVQDAYKKAQLQTVDQMLADGQITQAQADAMKARINAGQALGPVGGFRGFGFKRGNFGGRGVVGQLQSAELNAVASALHMNAADLKTALRSGKTLSDLESQQKVSDSAVKSAMKSAAKGVLDQAVKAGTITQAQEDAMLARVGSGNLRGFGFPRWSPAPASPGAPSQSPAATPAAYYSTI
ncbi:MAG TPA: hypothetical protein VHW91_00275 [Candidatus Dormibacteraeota bacterium]|nr:hypothetical protein [Candidatus Dormibacteraeota bacterium]